LQKGVAQKSPHLPVMKNSPVVQLQEVLNRQITAAITSNEVIDRYVEHTKENGNQRDAPNPLKSLEQLQDLKRNGSLKAYSIGTISTKVNGGVSRNLSAAIGTLSCTHSRDFL